MSRKFDLIKECDRVLNQSKTGRHTTHVWKKSVMHKVINDLIKNKCAPPSFKHFKQEHLKVLIQYWQSKPLKTETILKKISVIRSFLKIGKYNTSLPSNADLLTQGTKSKPKKIISTKNDLPQFKHPITKSIVAFQVEFGLTKTESIRLHLDAAIQNNFLLIDRALAHNNKDRIIPITSASQERVITERKSLINGKASLIQICPENDLKALLKSEHIICGTNSNTHYQNTYAKMRHETLLQGMSSDEATQKVQLEMGYATKYPILEVLNGK